MYKFGQNKVRSWQKFFQGSFPDLYTTNVPGELDYDLLDAIRKVEFILQRETGQDFVGRFVRGNAIIKGPEELYSKPKQTADVTPAAVPVSDNNLVVSFKTYLNQNDMYNGPMDGSITPDFIQSLKLLEKYLIEAILYVNPKANVSQINGMIWDGQKIGTTVQDVENVINAISQMKKEGQAALDAIDIDEEMPIAIKFNPTQDDANVPDYDPMNTQQIGKSEVVLPESVEIPEKFDDRYIELARISSNLLIK